MDSFNVSNEKRNENKIIEAASKNVFNKIESKY